MWINKYPIEQSTIALAAKGALKNILANNEMVSGLFCIADIKNCGSFEEEPSRLLAIPIPTAITMERIPVIRLNRSLFLKKGRKRKINSQKMPTMNAGIIGINGSWMINMIICIKDAFAMIYPANIGQVTKNVVSNKDA